MNAMRQFCLYVVIIISCGLVLGRSCVWAETQPKKLVISMESQSSEYPLEEAIKQRRSVRRYTAEQMSFSEVSKLLYYANGITKKGGFFGAFRAAPSAGACYPIELYLVANNIIDLENGLYWYDVAKNELIVKQTGSFAGRVADHCLDQRFIAEAEAIIIMTAVWDRTLSRYGDRGVQYIYLDAGHIAENIYLEATALGLAPCAIGAFRDKKMDTLLGVDGKKESCIYLMVVGK